MSAILSILATSGNREYLEAMAGDFDLEKAMGELGDRGVLEQVTFAQELDETMEKLKPDRDLLDINASLLSDDEREYLRAKDNRDRYHNDPERYKKWEEPRWRLKDDFKGFVKTPMESRET